MRACLMARSKMPPDIGEALAIGIHHRLDLFEYHRPPS